MKGIVLEKPFDGLLGYPQKISGGKSDGREYMYLYDPKINKGRLMSMARFNYSMEHGVIPESDLQVDHITEYKFDDSVDGLQLLTVEENNQKTVLMKQGFVRCQIPQFCQVCKQPIFSSKIVVTCSRTCNGKKSSSERVGALASRTIDVDTQLKIKELRDNGGTSYSISKDLKLSRNTVMKYW